MAEREDERTDGAPLAPGLYLVATPIGNLEDITLRALRVLRSVDKIACEDTRQTQKLLNHFDIQTPTISYHMHNEAGRAEELAVQLKAGARIARGERCGDSRDRRSGGADCGGGDCGGSAGVSGAGGECGDQRVDRQRDCRRVVYVPRIFAGEGGLNGRRRWRFCAGARTRAR